jgi:site-specific DNA recombinase
MLLDDIYTPFTFEEIQDLVAEGLISAEVAARLDRDGEYGIWWFNRRRFERRHVSEPDGNGGRVYRWRNKVIARPRSEWIGVPVPSSGIPREWLDVAREAIKDNPRISPTADYRYWELANMFVCGVCGYRMSKTRRTKGHGYEGYYHYYICPSRTNKGRDACTQVKGFRAEHAEAQVWELVRSLMLEPEQLLDDMERMIEEERRAVRGNPEIQAKAWLDKIAAVERKRSGFQDMAAECLITLDELREKLAGLDDLRKTAERELRAIEIRTETLQQLERDRVSLFEHYTNMAPEALDSLTPEERHQLYRILRLRVTAGADRTLAVEGIFGEIPSVHDETITWVIPLL